MTENSSLLKVSALNEMKYVVGVDVGTTSVRAALVDETGKIVKIIVVPIKIWEPERNFYIQSSGDVWSACCTAVKSVASGVAPERIKGIGFDATCSLVILDKNRKPLPAYPNGKADRNIIMWLDHRATAEAEFINRTQHAALKYTGGKISCEMTMAKLLWLKKNMHESCWVKAGYFTLLPDFLTYKSTGLDICSANTLLSKCGYLSSPYVKNGWNEDFIRLIGLNELLEENCAKIGTETIKPGELCGNLTKVTAGQLGLPVGIAVGNSFVDAHAAALALMSCKAPEIDKDFTSKIGLICGTSTCHMTVANTDLFIAGLWGPYYDAMIPGKWLIAGGQSASGKLIDHIIDTHPATSAIKGKTKKSMTDYLNSLLLTMAKESNYRSVDELTSSIHVYPDFHGNRSPIADATLKGMISGLSLSAGEKDLALLYLAVLQSLVYQTRQIINVMKNAGHENLKFVLLCGGMCKNDLFLQLHANIIDLPVLYSTESEMALVGSAMAAASAAKIYSSLVEAASSMANSAKLIKRNPDTTEYHDKKYKIFLEMLEHQKIYKKIMSDEK